MRSDDAAVASTSEDPDELVQVELTLEERQMLSIGLNDWGGPAYGSEPLAQAMGFEDLDNLCEESQLVGSAIRDRQVPSRRDWTRAMVATEVAADLG